MYHLFINTENSSHFDHFLDQNFQLVRCFEMLDIFLFFSVFALLKILYLKCFFFRVLNEMAYQHNDNMIGYLCANKVSDLRF